MKKKVLSVLLCTSMVAGLMAGCGGQKDDGKVHLKIYAQYADDDTKIPYDYAAAAVKEKYPNVELELVIQAQDDGATLDTLASTGQLPDIFQSNTNIINTFRETNQVMQLDDIAKSSGYLDKVIDTNKELVYSDDGHIYCFPYAGNEYVLWYYNKEVFAKYNLEVPTTYEELLNCVKVFKDNGVTPLALFGAEGWITTAMYDAIATRYANGGIKDLDTGKASIDDKAYVDAAEILAELAEAGLFQESVTTTNYDQASELFLNGDAAMFLNGQWYINDATAKLGDNVDWMFYPSYDKASYEANKYAFAGGGSTSGFSVNPDGKNAELAAEVAAFMAEKYCEVKVMKRGTPLVALNTGAKPETEFPAMMQKLSDTIPSMTSTTKFTWGLTNNKFNTAITTNTQGLVSCQYTAKEFIEDVKEAIK